MASSCLSTAASLADVIERRASSNGLFAIGDCDRTSETFLVSYLKHEARHFADTLDFPNLSGADLEYRAKLTELAFACGTSFEKQSTR